MGVAHWWFRCYEVTCCKLEVMRSNPTWVYLCPMSCEGFGAPRGIVVAGMGLQLLIPLVTKKKAFQQIIFTYGNICSNIMHFEELMECFCTAHINTFFLLIKKTKEMV